MMEPRRTQVSGTEVDDGFLFRRETGIVCFKCKKKARETNEKAHFAKKRVGNGILYSKDHFHFICSHRKKGPR